MPREVCQVYMCCAEDKNLPEEGLPYAKGHRCHQDAHLFGSSALLPGSSIPLGYQELGAKKTRRGSEDVVGAAGASRKTLAKSRDRIQGPGLGPEI